MMFLDANVILRFLTNDHPDKAQRCLALFEQADSGAVQLTTSEAIIAEVVYVLSSPRLYHVPRDRIRELLLPIIDLRGLKVTSRQLYHDALDLYASRNLDFEDALALAHMRELGIAEITSYARHFDDLEGVRRVEP